MMLIVTKAICKNMLAVNWFIATPATANLSKYITLQRMYWFQSKCEQRYRAKSSRSMDHER